MIDVEDALRDGLRRQAQRAPEGDGWDAIHHRVERRARARQVRRSAVTVAVVAVLTAGAVGMAGSAGRRGDGTTNVAAAPGSLPRLVPSIDGLSFLAAGESSDGSGYKAAYAWLGHPVQVRVQEGGPGAVDALVADRSAAGGAVTKVIVGGQPGVQIASPGSVTVIWAPRAGVVAEMSADGEAATQARALLDSMREATADEWKAMLNRTVATGADVNVPALDPASAALDGICVLPANWLSARAGGDAPKAAESLQLMRAVVDKMIGTGAASRGNLLALTQDLVTAMASGDEGAVRATTAAVCSGTNEPGSKTGG